MENQYIVSYICTLTLCREGDGQPYNLYTGMKDDARLTWCAWIRLARNCSHNLSTRRREADVFVCGKVWVCDEYINASVWLCLSVLRPYLCVRSHLCTVPSRVTRLEPNIRLNLTLFVKQVHFITVKVVLVCDIKQTDWPR